MIILRELDASFVYIRTAGRSYQLTSVFGLAQGLTFFCPKCEGDEAHMVLCWFRDKGVPDSETPGPGRWHARGSSLDDLTLSPSIHLPHGCGWHGYVAEGMVKTV